MKKIILTVAMAILAFLTFAQVPQTMSYQGVVRDADNALVVSKAVSIELSILQGSDEGDVVYAEKHDVTTNANGLVSLELGGGEQISETAFSQIDWSAGPYFVKTVAEFDGKTVTGITPMLTVPYAMFAEKAGNIPDLTDYAKKSDIPEGANLEGYVKNEELSEYAKSADVDNTYVKKAEMPATLEDYAKTSDVSTALDELEGKIPAAVELDEYAKSADVAHQYVTKEAFETYVMSGGQSDAVDLSVYAKNDTLAYYAKSTDVNASLTELEGKIPAEADLTGFVTSEKLNDTLSVYALKKDLPEETNLENYVTNEALSEYAKTADVESALSTLEGKIPEATNLDEYAKTADVNASLAELEAKIPAEADLTGFVTSEKMNDTLNVYAKSADVAHNYVTKDAFEKYVMSGGQSDAVDLSVYAKNDTLAYFAKKEELSALNIPSVDGLASETYVDEKVAAIQIPSVPAKVSDLENDANYITLNDVPATDLSGYYTKTDVDGKFAEYATKEELNALNIPSVEGLASETYVNEKVAAIQIPSTEGLATKEELNALNIPSVDGLASETYVNEKVAAIQIPSVPTKVGELENDANYITLNDVPATDLSGYATTAKLNDTLDAYVLKSQIGTTNLDGYYSKAEVDALLAEMNERFAALSDWVEASKNPKLSKPTLSKMVDTDVTLNAKITSAGFGDIIERGFVCSRTPNPTVADNEQKYVSSGTSVDENYIGGFSYLASGYTYYIRAYATSSTGTGYSEPYILTTTLMAPVINSGGSRNVTAESFEMHSSVKFEAQITQWGFCYSDKTEYPTTSNDKVTVDVSGLDFEATISGLQPGQTYYVRPFATNSMGTTYGSTYFVTTLCLPATVGTPTTTEVAGKSFRVTAVLIDDGGAVSSKGFCYSTSENPTIDGPKVSGYTGEGNNFNATVSGLSPVTTYYVRAYATNSAGTSYSEQITVTTTAVLATVADVTSSEITGVSFNVSSAITNNGGAEVTEKGFCYATTENPTVENSKQAVDGDDFETTIDNLAVATTYYVRAYAVNSVGTSYSEQISVKTLAVLATVASVTSFEITEVSFKVSSEITANGGAEVTEKGFCYATTENPTIENSKQAVDGDDFETTIGELANGTTYYVRAYAVNSVGMAYSEQIEVSTLTTLATLSAPTTDVTWDSFTVNASIVSNGGAEITEKGFCYSTTENPTVESPKKVVVGGLFNTTIGGLSPETTYYIRAYAINSVGIAYSEQVTAVTQKAPYINGKFSVSANTKVYFSMGNLQYNRSQDTWSFAEHQYDTVGERGNIYGNVIDLFCYGTSGYTKSPTYYTYGQYSTTNYPRTNISGTAYDWGAHNPISNGGNQSGMWLTLSQSQWKYLLESRTNASEKKGEATVNGVCGLILLPDSWTLPTGLEFTSNGNYTDNVYTVEDWATMEANGAVFLPAAGSHYRAFTDGKHIVISVGVAGSYWTGTYYKQNNNDTGYFVSFGSAGTVKIANMATDHGNSVRLVKYVE